MDKPSNNEKLEVLLEKAGIEKPEMVRHSYIIENSEGKLLVVQSGEETFPIITFGNTWQLLSDSYYYCDMWDADVIVTAIDCIKNYTEIEVGLKELELISYTSFNTKIEYNSEQLDGVPNGDGAQTSNYSFLNLYYYVKLDVADFPEFWDEYHQGYKWLSKRAAMELMKVDKDIEAVEKMPKDRKNILA